MQVLFFLFLFFLRGERKVKYAYKNNHKKEKAATQNWMNVQICKISRKLSEKCIQNICKFNL